MKRTLMIGVAAGALLAGVNFASAQGAMERQQPGAAGGASIEQKGAVQKKGGDVQKKGGELKAQGGTELKSQGGAELKGSKARAQAPGDVKAGSEMKAQETQKPDEKKMKGEKGKNAQSKDQLKSETSAQGDEKKMKGEKGKKAQSKEPAKSGASAQGDVKAGGSATTGQGSAGASAKASLTVEQKTKIRETVFKSGPRVTKVNFSLSVGTVVPRTVRFAPLPIVLVEIYPQWRGYEYFIVEEEIIIIEPRTLKIIAIIQV